MQEAEEVESTRYRNLPLPLRIVFLLFTVVGIVLGIIYVFGLRFQDFYLGEFDYYYLLLALFLTCIFLLLPARKKDKTRFPWYDLLGAALAFGVNIYFFLNAEAITLGTWAIPTAFNFTPALIITILVLEGGRRMGGNIFLAICVVLGLYPIFAGHMPGMLGGYSFSFERTICSEAFSANGLMGLPTKVMGEILIAFLVFAGLLISSGAGKFFINLAFALLGRNRGGPAKVAVVASGFFGSLSGGAMSNVIATGSITIPTMKRIGYPPEYAGAIEACASTGGTLMPPVMGAVAFMLCEFLGIEYAVVVIAAFIPSILYYLGLLIQTDAYAARVGLRGLPGEEVPPIKKTLAEGWQFIVVIIFLLWGLVYMRWEAMTAFYGAGLMFMLSFLTKENKMTPKRILQALVTIGSLMVQTVAILLPIGIITNGLFMSGMSVSFAAGLVYLGGGHLWAVILLGVVTCYIMGMAGLLSAAYILLAILMAPSLVNAFNLNPLAVHLFILYYSMLAAFTPPVAAAAFVAATIANTSPMRVALRAVRLGVVIYIIPFFFLFHPALIFQGPILETLYLFVLCVLGIILISAGLEGYLLRVGKMRFWERILITVAGFMIAFPEGITGIIGGVLAIITIAITLIQNKRKVSQSQVV